MVDDSLALLTAHPEWAPVLEAYRQRELEVAQRAPATHPSPATIPATAPLVATPVTAAEGGNAGLPTETSEADGEDEDSRVGWVDRVHEVPGTEREVLSQIHGRLIAFGLLRCEIAPKSVGLVYRLSPQGKSALKSFPASQHAARLESA